MSYALEIQIAPADLAIFMRSGFNLCLTKGVRMGNEKIEGNVVYSTVPSKDLATDLLLSWEENYQVYMTDKFQAS